MSEAIAFDTHRYVKRLTENGFSEQQAETLADEQVNLLNTNLATKADIERVNENIEMLRQATKSDIENLRQATKSDIEKLRLETKSDIEKLRLETKSDIEMINANIERVKSDLLKWMLGALIAQGGLIVTLLKLL